MEQHDHQLKIFSCRNSRYLAEKIAEKLGEMSADVKKNEKLLDTLKLSKVNANNIF